MFHSVLHEILKAEGLLNDFGGFLLFVFKICGLDIKTMLRIMPLSSAIYVNEYAEKHCDIRFC